MYLIVYKPFIHIIFINNIFFELFPWLLHISHKRFLDPYIHSPPKESNTPLSMSWWTNIYSNYMPCIQWCIELYLFISKNIYDREFYLFKQFFHISLCEWNSLLWSGEIPGGRFITSACITWGGGWGLGIFYRFGCWPNLLFDLLVLPGCSPSSVMP